MEALIIELYYALFYQQSYPIHLDVGINRDNTALLVEIGCALFLDPIFRFNGQPQEAVAQ